MPDVQQYLQYMTDLHTEILTVIAYIRPAQCECHKYEWETCKTPQLDEELTERNSS